MTFRSKVDWWIAVLGLGIPLASIAKDFTAAGMHGLAASWLVIPVLVGIALFLCPIVYVIEGRHVVIRGGFIRWEMGVFAVDDIDSVRPTHNPLSAPALSIDRLRVDLRSGAMALISPKDKAGFLRALAGLDPALAWEDGKLVRQR